MAFFSQNWGPIRLLNSDRTTSMLESSPPRTGALTKRLTILYMAALAMIALLTIIGQFVVQRAIIRLEGDSRIVNIAGRQRMLSQRLTRLTLELAYTEEQSRTNSLDDANRASSQTDTISSIRTDLDTWGKNHEGLQRGSEILQLPGKNSEIVKKLFEELTPHFEAMRKIVESALTRVTLAVDAILNTAGRKELSYHSDSFLAEMDNIVSRLEQEARDRVNRLQWIESVLLFATIAVLVCEGLFIFSPAVGSLSRSLTKLQCISDELEKAKGTAEKANMAKTNFLARISHELRTPLHAILGMLELVEQSKLRSNQRAKIHLANEASRSLLTLVDELLDVASIELGREIVLHPFDVDIRSLLSSTFELMKPMAIEKGLQFQLNFDDALPNRVTIDADKVRQVVTNLLQNAIRYTPLGFVHCNVDTLIEVNQLFLRVAVEDSGIGISNEDQDRIFASFRRVNSDEVSSTFGRPMGIGLAITQAMVKKLNGLIILTSEVGKGSRFVVMLPIQPVMESMRQIEPASKLFETLPSESPTENESRPTALIVDDSPTNLLVMRSYLKHLGYRTMSVASLRESVVKFRRYHFDLVFMDRHLSDGDGLNFPKMLKRNLFEENNLDGLSLFGATKVFLVTAEIYLQPNGDRRMNPFAGVLHKPISLDQLSRAINSTNRSGHVELSWGNKRNFDLLRKKLAVDFMERFSNEIETIESKLAVGDYSAIEFISHRIFGGAGNAGLIEIAELARELHKAATEENKKCIEEVLCQLTDRLVANEGPGVARHSQ